MLSTSRIAQHSTVQAAPWPHSSIVRVCSPPQAASRPHSVAAILAPPSRLRKVREPLRLLRVSPLCLVRVCFALSFVCFTLSLASSRLTSSSHQVTLRHCISSFRLVSVYQCLSFQLC
ncbi:putative ATP-binding cassette sub-family A member 7 [Sesbania bispinosa]|nr:putative ATP-binding cassette sub-family A member 7 [Sesbania bispinosa]